MVVALLAACQTPVPTSAPVVQPISAPAAMVETVSPVTAPAAKNPIAPQTPTQAGSDVASWETSHPFGLASLVARRLLRELGAPERRQINVATARALADERGDLHRWQTDQPKHKGVVRLVRRTVVGDGRVCAQLHHEHQFGRRAIRGSVRICRRRGDSAAPWQVDDVRWIRLGNELAGIAASPRIVPTPA
jgi:hypothetical protein